MQRTLVGDLHPLFVTAYDSHAVQAFEQGALDYLVKPLEAARVNLHAIREVVLAERGTATIRLKGRDEALPVSRNYLHQFRQMSLRGGSLAAKNPSLQNFLKCNRLHGKP